MSVTFSDLRAAVASNVANVSGMTLAKMAPEYFLRQQNTIAHKSYTVAVAQSNATPERQRRGVGVYVQTNVVVTFAHRLRPLDVYPTDYDAALDLERDIINQVLQTYSVNKAFTIRYNSSVRTVGDSQEYITVACTFTALHTITQ
jgi:hypothetical protein